MMFKFIRYLLISSLIVLFFGCTKFSSQTAVPKVKPVYLQVPSTSCEIRKWYNYQVVAISIINKRWIEQGISLRDRAKQAYTLRHNARINARFMMKDKATVKKFEVRDYQKYGNRNGPTFSYLVDKLKAKGIVGEEGYREIIKSSSRTSPNYNLECNDQ